jgi:ABC-2 type transport system permease protein
LSDLAILVRQTRYALLSASRNSRVVVFGVVFPVVLLLLFNSAFTSGGNDTTSFAGGTIDTKAYYTAGMSAYAISMQSFSSLVVGLTEQRESGQLKRLRGTPMPVWTFIAATALRALALTVLMVLALYLISWGVYGVHPDAAGVGGIAVYVLLGTAALTTVGMAVTALARTTDSAAVIGPFTAVLLSFVSGIFIPLDTLPNWLGDIGRIFPLYHLAEGLQRATVGNGSTGLVAENVAVLAAWAVAGLLVAANRFRWEPQGAGA